MSDNLSRINQDEFKRFQNFIKRSDNIMTNKIILKNEKMEKMIIVINENNDISINYSMNDDISVNKFDSLWFTYDYLLKCNLNAIEWKNDEKFTTKEEIYKKESEIKDPIKFVSVLLSGHIIKLYLYDNSYIIEIKYNMTLNIFQVKTTTICFIQYINKKSIKLIILDFLNRNNSFLLKMKFIENKK